MKRFALVLLVQVILLGMGRLPMPMKQQPLLMLRQ